MALSKAHAEVISLIPRDLGEIGHNLRWAYYDGYLPNAPTAVRSSGIISGPDNVPGAKFDFGLASNRSREAFNASLRLLGIAEVHIAAALIHYTGGGPTMPLARPFAHKGELEPAAKAMSLMLERLSRIETLARQKDAVRSQPLYEMEPTDHLLKAAKALYECKCLLTKALGESGSQKPAQICVTCGHRPAQTDKYGIRCSPCYHYLRRHGKERPRRLDKGKVSMVTIAEAKARREAQGLSYGVG